VSISAENQIADPIEAVMYHPHFTSQQSRILSLSLLPLGMLLPPKIKSYGQSLWKVQATIYIPFFKCLVVVGLILQAVPSVHTFFLTHARDTPSK